MAKEFNISKAHGACTLCQKPLEPGDEIVATVREGDQEFLRQDYCPPCWTAQAQDDKELLGIWHTRVPAPQERKKLLIDDDLLVNFFERLAGTDSPAKRNFRFVLALVLMRKKLLVYDRMIKGPDGQEVWKMHFKGTPDAHDVINPRMDEEKIVEVSQSLGEIMEGQL